MSLIVKTQTKFSFHKQNVSRRTYIYAFPLRIAQLKRAKPEEDFLRRAGLRGKILWSCRAHKIKLDISTQGVRRPQVLAQSRNVYLSQCLKRDWADPGLGFQFVFTGLLAWKRKVFRSKENNNNNNNNNNNTVDTF